MRKMVFGHNTNLSLGAVKFHVQTEDRGESHALIDTTVYYKGRVLHRRTNSYFDLLPMNSDREHALRLRLDEQHRTVIEEIRSGSLQLALPAVVERAAEPVPAAVHEEKLKPAAIELPKLVLELINAKSWISGKNALLQVRVQREDGYPVEGAQVHAQIEGSDDPQIYGAPTGSFGHAQIEFAMPRITGSEAALVIRVEDHGLRGQLRFALRAKTRVPSV
jgi:hypothetical protein